MKSIFDIRIQKLFFVVFTLKFGSSFLGWKLGDPWILGFAVPLLMMGVYIVVGLNRRDKEVSDEKFADTCYYLGFLFTITSIIFSLFDLPQIGTRIQDIAIRFGAAMVSTVLGLFVRVYLVSFKKEAADALQDAETAVLDATRKFTEQLTISLEHLRDFEYKVDTAAKASVERVNLQVENLSKNHADKLTEFFADLTGKNQEAFTEALGEVKKASQSLAVSVDGYSLGMRANLSSIEAKVGAFTDAVTERLRTTTFPDDYFEKHLNGPLEQLTEVSSTLAGSVKAANKDVTGSLKALTNALGLLNAKAAETESSLDTVLSLTRQQMAVLEAAEGQVATQERVGFALDKVSLALGNALAGITANAGLTSELTTRISSVIAEGAVSRKSLEAGLATVSKSVEAQTHATQTVAAALEASTAAQTVSATCTVAKLEAVAIADLTAVQPLDTLGTETASALGRVQGAVEQLQGIARLLSAAQGPAATAPPAEANGAVPPAPLANGFHGGLPGRLPGGLLDGPHSAEPIVVGTRLQAPDSSAGASREDFSQALASQPPVIPTTPTPTPTATAPGAAETAAFAPSPLAAHPVYSQSAAVAPALRPEALRFGPPVAASAQVPSVPVPVPAPVPAPAVGPTAAASPVPPRPSPSVPPPAPSV